MSMAELATFLEANAAYATLVDAFSGLNLVITEGVGATGTAIAVAGGPASVAVGTIGDTALELAATAQLQATGMGVKTAGIGLLQGQSSFSAAGLLAIDVGTVAGAVAPFLGVSLGSDLYQSNPELWRKISETLLPFCYDGTIEMPAWVAKVGEFYEVAVNKGIFDALKSLFEEEGIGGSEGYSISNPLVTIPMPVPTTNEVTYTAYGAEHKFECTTGHMVVVENPDYYEVAYFRGPGEADTLNYDGSHSAGGSNISVTTLVSGIYVSCRISNNIILKTWDMDPVPTYSKQSVSNFYAQVATTIYDGSPAGGNYPDGTSQWTGNVPSQLPQSRPAVTGIESGTGNPITTPTIPIAPPYPIIIVPDPIEDPEPELIPFPWTEPEYEPHTEPWPETMPWPLPEEEPEWWPVEIPYPDTYPLPQPSIDPEISPDPDKITDPDQQISPYIQPLPLPWKTILPDKEETIDPYADPSQPENPGPPTTEDPPIDLDPPPEGISPWPVLPTTPLPFSSGGGLVTVYHPTDQQLYAFENWLWVELANADINTVWNNPFDGVITLFELYCTPTDVGTRNIHSGFLDSGISSSVISRYTEIDCGTIGIPEYYGNYFDYSPYSKAHIYLPFIGIQELNVDDIVGHCVNVTYRIDEYNGACIAMITVAKVTNVNGTNVEYSNTMYQFSGNCSVELPIAGGSQAQIKAGLMMADATRQAAVGMAGLNLVGGLASLLFGSVGGALGGLTSGLGGLASGELSALGHMLSGKSTVQKSGSFGSSHGALGIKTPFIVITRPKQIQVQDYEKEYGFPAHKMVKIGDCTGFLRCREVHVISPTANDEEKSLIEQLLKSGVYLT